MSRYIDILNTNCLFSGLSEEQLLRYTKILHAQIETYGKGEVAHGADQPFSRFGLVLSGSVNVLIDDIEGNRTLMAHVEKGITFGESLCLLHTNPAAVFVMADEETEIMWLSVDNLFCGSSDPDTVDLERRFAVMIARRSLALNNRIQILAKLTLREKLMAFFTFSAKDGAPDRVTVPFSRENMARYMGTNRSALCRELSAMQRDGLIDCKGKQIQLLHNRK